MLCSGKHRGRALQKVSPFDISLDVEQGQVLKTVKKYWGFDSLRPVQGQTMSAVLDRRDSLVILPTGGGKSICYQAPAVHLDRLVVVVSPLIALMKDQVDSLTECGIRACQINSSLSAKQKRENEDSLVRGEVNLVFVSPERLAEPGFLAVLKELDIHAFAIDEAHCISHWGHDFRPEYRQLSSLKTMFPQASVHAFTATATPKVRQDIIDQLALESPEILIGSFDRPNLSYRAAERLNPALQIREVLARHEGEAGIIYCIKRKEVDALVALLKKEGHSVIAYHAGLSPEERRKAQEKFRNEEVDLVVATVAFGMGIDRSNVRFVMHTGMPKSLEHYQQEAGRAGRDGLEAECVLFYSGSDLFIWNSIIESSAKESGADEEFLQSAKRHLYEMDRYCRGGVCRHRALVEHFGQVYPGENCGACDICLGEVAQLADSRKIADIILGCIASMGGRYGVGYISSVLRGEAIDQIGARGHRELLQHGMLSQYDKAEVGNFIRQLAGQGLLKQAQVKTGSGQILPVIELVARAEDLVSESDANGVRLFSSGKSRSAEKAKPHKSTGKDWDGVDRELFEKLKRERTKLAGQKKCPAYFIFSDLTLRELARQAPRSKGQMLAIHGVGEAKVKQYADVFLPLIEAHLKG